jgi:hypothetical protein
MGSLFIKYRQDDTGIRPIKPCADFWVSPSLWLTGGLDATTAKVGVVNTIHAVVDNMTDAPQKTGVRVQVWVCNFTIGVGPAAVTPSSPGGASGSIRTIGAVDAGAGGEVTVDWTPTEDDLINSSDPNSGHVCLGANSFTLTDAAPEGAQWTAQSGFLDICGNQHHAQKNIAVRKVVPGIKTVFHLKLANPELETRRFVVRVREVVQHEQLGLGEREHLLSGALVEPIGLRPEELEQIKAETHGEPFERAWLRAGARLKLANVEREVQPAARPVAELELVTDDGHGTDLEITMAGRTLKPVAVEVVVAKDTPFGTVNVIDVTQSNRADQLVGGTRLMTVSVPEDLMD